MVGIPFRTAGVLYRADQRAALLLSVGAGYYTVRLGYVMRGTGQTLLPETLLDDWGHEVGGVDLYLWVKENGAHFPRAELFGLDGSGRAMQCFLRELDLTAGYACRVYEDSTRAAIKDGVELTAILVPVSGSGQQRQREAPAKIPFPLRDAHVEWWTVALTVAQDPKYDFFRTLEQDESA